MYKFYLIASLFLFSMESYSQVLKTADLIGSWKKSKPELVKFSFTNDSMVILNMGVYKNRLFYYKIETKNDSNIVTMVSKYSKGEPKLIWKITLINSVKLKLEMLESSNYDVSIKLDKKQSFHPDPMFLNKVVNK